MRSFSWFMLAIAGTLVLAAALAYPVYLLAVAIEPGWAFHRVVTRFWQLSMLAGIAACVWGLRLKGRDAWGYGLVRPRFAAQFGAGLAVGVATMLAVTALMIGLGIRQPLPGPGATGLAVSLASGLATGLAVGLLEETFFRGLMFSAIRRESGARAAILLTAVVYAAIHFLARTKIPAAEVDPASGWMLLKGVLRWFGEPAAMADAFLSLLAVGVLLGMARQWTGSIAVCIGLHAGWVWVIKATTATTRAVQDAPLGWLVSRFDGFTGWLVLTWACLLAWLVWHHRHRFSSCAARVSPPAD